MLLLVLLLPLLPTDNTRNTVTTVNFTTIAIKIIILTYTAIATMKINIIQINVLLIFTSLQIFRKSRYFEG